MANRNSLHVSKLQEFRAFCEGRGWIVAAPKGEFEVLRMTKPNEQVPLIVHRRLASRTKTELQHLSVHGHSERMVRKFLNQK